MQYFLVVLDVQSYTLFVIHSPQAAFRGPCRSAVKKPFIVATTMKQNVKYGIDTSLFDSV